MTTHFHTIITHPGSAHKDEFLACSVLIAMRSVSIVRRDPLETDLSDPEVCVIDIGHRHEPELHNFDHHQFPHDHAPTCSLSLVLQYLGLYHDARKFLEWLEPAEWFDCRGPIATAKWLGIERNLLHQLTSPIDVTLLRRFAASNQHVPGEPIWEVMRMIGEDLLGYLRNLHQRMEFLSANAEFWEIDTPDGPARVFFVPRTDPLPEDPSAGMERFIECVGMAAEVIAVVYPDRRNSGYGLSRFRDNPRLDFCQLETQPDVHFTHARGFLAKSTANQVARLRELLQLAYVTKA